MAELRTRGEDLSGLDAGAEEVPVKPGRRTRRTAPRAPASISEAADRLLLLPSAVGPATEPKPRAPRRKRPPRPAPPALESISAPAAIEAPAPPAPSPQAAGFRDLLGQAVGLRLDGAGRIYRSGRVQVNALEGAYLQVAPGEFLAVTGPSGCGKSTLLNLVGGLDRATSGRVFAAGVPLGQLGEEELARYRLQRVGTVFQDFKLMPELTVAGNVALPMALAGIAGPERAARVARLLELVGLTDRAGHRPNRLSGGERQRVAVARALANRPGLILADEPTGSLDSESGELILNLLAEANRRGSTVVVVTHDPAVASRAGRVVTMRDGRLPAGDRERRVEHAPAQLERPRRLGWADALLLAVARIAFNRGAWPAGLALSGVLAFTTVLLALAGGLQDRVLGGLSLVAGGIAITGVLAATGLVRGRDLGVLRALGASGGALGLIHAIEAGLLGAVGTAGGLALAAAAGWAAGRLPAALLSRIGESATLRSLQLTPRLMVAVGALAVGLSVVGGLVAALAAARRRPAELLRNG